MCQVLLNYQIDLNIKNRSNYLKSLTMEIVFKVLNYENNKKYSKTI